MEHGLGVEGIRIDGKGGILKYWKGKSSMGRMGVK